MDTFIIAYETASALRHLLMAVECAASAAGAKSADIHLKDARRRIHALDQLIHDERDRLAESRPQLGGLDFKTGRRDSL